MLNEKLKIVSRLNNSDHTTSNEFSRVRRKINENSSGVLNSSECGLLVGNATKTILNENEKKRGRVLSSEADKGRPDTIFVKTRFKFKHVFFCAIDLIQFE